MRKNLSTGVVWIRAALNDGNPECWKEEDEIERSTDWVSYYFPGLELGIMKLHPSIFSPLLLSLFSSHRPGCPYYRHTLRCHDLSVLLQK